MITPRMDFYAEERDLTSLAKEQSECSDEAMSELSVLESDEEPISGHKIPKPPGEAGHPGSGGYNLKDVLGWAKAEFDQVQVA